MPPQRSSRNTKPLPQAQSTLGESPCSGPMNVIVLTPMMGGADGISEMTRQWLRVLESRVGRDVGTLDVWSLDDATRPDMPAGASARFITAGRGPKAIAAVGRR